MPDASMTMMRMLDYTLPLSPFTFLCVSWFRVEEGARIGFKGGYVWQSAVGDTWQQGD
jgi:hypothetical protein